MTAHRLAAGTLHLDAPADAPVRIAERLNPRRAFLFVSTLLGRHIPVDPRAHRAALKDLAALTAPHLGAGPVLVMGFAETAVGLGAGVFEELRHARPARQVGYLPTTRFPTGAGHVWFTAHEAHSHAADHNVLRPASGVWPEGPDISLVLVDDETTTGATFADLARGIAAAGLVPSHVVLVTLTDWSGGAAEAALARVWPPAAVASATLARGRWSWAPDPAARPAALPAGRSPDCPRWTPRAAQPFAAPRTGLAAEAPGPDGAALLARLEAAGLARGAPRDRVLVVGTGEHVWQPFLVAEALAARGAEAALIATTRSPVAEGAVIRRKAAFADHYGLGLEMYLHNVDPAAWDAILVMTETGMGGLPESLLRALPGAWLVDGDGLVERTPA